MFRTRTSTAPRPAGRLRLGLAALALLVPGLALAQSGKIAGVVTDAATGEPLPGVNVVIDGTTQGASTDLDGEYVIIGIRPGTYALVASYIGFQTTRVQDVRVQIDLTTEVDIALREEVLEGEEIVVVAERPLVQKDQTATTAVVSGEEIRAIPVENFSDVVGLQAGVVNGHFRGGRLGEVGYWVDGMPVTDVFDGGLALQVENNTVEELQVVTGAFNAEYGQAMSGIVNVVTRDGRDEFAGGMQAFAGDYALSDSDVFRDLGGLDPAHVYNVEADLSGPVIPGKLWFFTSGRVFHNDGWLMGRDVFKFDDIGFDPTGRLDLLNPGGSGDSSAVALNPYDKISGQAKLTYRLAPSIRVAANVIVSQEDFKSGGQGLFFFPDGRLDQQRQAGNAYLKWTHTLSNTTFYDAGLTASRSTFEEFLFEDPTDERYVDNDFFGFNDFLQTAGFLTGGTNNRRFRRETQTVLGKLDVTSQLNRSNLVKAGVEFRHHTLDYDEQFVVVDEESGISGVVATGGRYSYQPIELSAYVQDKVELGSLIINAGVRFDYFDSRGRILADPRDPDVVFGARPDPFGTDFSVEGFTREASPKWQFSPRLGVAFPITETGVIHFSYGHFFQIPNFELLYQNPFFQLGSGGSGLVGLLGNADLEPEQTINGEIGLKQQLTETSAVELTAYYRDIRNLTGTATDPIQVAGTSARYGILVNSDFGFVRGVVLRFDQRIGDNFFAGFDYTYQVAKANASDPAQVYNAAAAKQQLETQIVSTNWDQRHTANLSLSYTDATGFGFGLIGQFGSGEPYTPSLSTKQTGAIVPTRIPLNSERKPVTFTVDLNAYKDFRFAGQTAQVFGRVNNLFDARNEFGVFGDTGRATYSLQQAVDAATFRGDPAFLDRWYTRSDFFAEPRRVVLGVSYRF